MYAMIAIFLMSMIFLVPVISRLPKLMKNKRTTGFYFANDPRILISKSEGLGNNLNFSNKYVWIISAIIGFIILGVFIFRLF